MGAIPKLQRFQLLGPMRVRHTSAHIPWGAAPGLRRRVAPRCQPPGMCGTGICETGIHVPQSLARSEKAQPISETPSPWGVEAKVQFQRRDEPVRTIRLREGLPGGTSRRSSGMLGEVAIQPSRARVLKALVSTLEFGLPPQGWDRREQWVPSVVVVQSAPSRTSRTTAHQVGRGPLLPRQRLLDLDLHGALPLPVHKSGLVLRLGLHLRILDHKAVHLPAPQPGMFQVTAIQAALPWTGRPGLCHLT